MDQAFNGFVSCFFLRHAKPAHMAEGEIRVGLVGFGALGRFLAERLEAEPGYRLVWIYNRTPVAHKLFRTTVTGADTDLVVEVAHPDVLQALQLLGLGCDVFVGSPTCFAAHEAHVPADVACYVPVGALWGAQDIAKMQRSGTLEGLTVVMAKHPSHLASVCGEVRARLDRYVADETQTGPCELYRGPVGPLCPQAPNNVNTLPRAMGLANSERILQRPRLCFASPKAFPTANA